MRVAELLPRAVWDRELNRHAEQLAEGLVELGVDADVIPAPSLLNARARRAAARRYDLVDVHGLEALAALARARIPARRLVFTPHQTRAGRAVRRRMALVASADAVICTSAGEARLTARAAPSVVDRIHVVPEGVDLAEIERADPIPTASSVVLAMACRTGDDQVDQLVAALAGLDDRFQVVLLGRRDAGRSLSSLAADLGVTARLLFAGSVSAAERHRWLKTAHVVVALSVAPVFDPALLEAVWARTPVVASDTVAHREMAAYAPRGHVQLVSIPASPLALADAIARAEPARDGAATPRLPFSATRPERVLAVYRSLFARPPARPPLIRVEANGSSGAAGPATADGRFTRVGQRRAGQERQHR